MLAHRYFRRNTQRYGIVAVALVMLVQAFAAASMPMATSSSNDGPGAVVICTGGGMKTVSLAQFLGQDADTDQEAPGTLLPAGEGGLCALCLLAHHFVALAPAAGFLCATDLTTHAAQAPLGGTLSAGAHYLPQQPRAPPSNA